MAKNNYMRWIALLLLFPSASFADDWTYTDIGLEATYAATHIADWGQTLNIDCTHNTESNSILGACPSRSRVNAYFATTLILHGLAANYLTGKWRTAFQVITIGIEANAVHHNARLGVKINF